jgi:hypothetical protein
MSSKPTLGTILSPENPATSTAASSAGSSGVERLNPFPGLFLRSEHLNLIQDYGREVAHLIGEASGGGVVRGFPVSLDQGEESPAVVVGPGLATTAAGEPLRSTENLRIPLEDVRPDVDRFWWIEIASTSWTVGNEPVAGVICDDPCSAVASSGRPRLAQGVIARLREDRANGLDTAPGQDPPTTSRSWLAARIYEAEATAAGRWVPGGPARLNDKRWGPVDQDWPRQFATPPHVVRIGILLRPVVDGNPQWTVDAWAARRDRGAPPPERDWQWRLGMRPWDVFISQVLQFQQEVAELQYPAVELARKGNGEAIWEALPILRITELPPAVFLPRVGETAADIVGEVQRLLDNYGNNGQVDLSYCWCAPGDVGSRFAQAQHRDRIALRSGSAGQLRIFVPGVADSGQKPDRNWKPVGDWVLLVRDEDVSCLEELPQQDRSHAGAEVWVGRYSTDPAYEEARAALAAGAEDIPGTVREGPPISERSERAGRLPSRHSHGYREIVTALTREHREATVGATVLPGRGLSGVARTAMVRRLTPEGVSPPGELEPVERAGTERVVLLIRDNG